MTPEQRDELIHFILQSQADAAEELREMRRRMEASAAEQQQRAAEQQAEQEKHAAEIQAEIQAEIRAHSADLREQTAQIQTLAALGHDLVEVARIHARRLDRLEGI